VPTGKKRGKSLAPGSTPASRVAILLEDIQGKVQATMEAVTAFRGEARRDNETLRAELSRRIDVLELAVRQNSADIRQNSEDIRKNTEGIRQNSADIRKNSEDIRQNSEDIRKNTEAIGQNSADIRQNSADIRSLRELLERKADQETLLRLEARVQVAERRLGIQ